MQKFVRVLSMCIFAVTLISTAAVGAAQAPSATIFFSGKLDGYLPGVFPSPDLSRGGILVGMGDNLALNYDARKRFLTPVAPSGISFYRNLPQPKDSPIVSYMLGNSYTAVVPGAQDFDFGAAFLYEANSQAGLPLVAGNVVLCSKESAAGSSSQPPPAQQILLPSEVSLPSTISLGVSSGSSGKGKSGGSSGGSSSAGSSSAPSGGASSPATYGCAAGSVSTGHDPAQLAKLIFPSPGSIYPWTTTIAISLPKEIKLTNVLLKSEGSLVINVTNPPANPTNGDTSVYSFDLFGSIEPAKRVVSDTGKIIQNADPKNYPLAPGSKLTLTLSFDLSANVIHVPDGVKLQQEISLDVQRPLFDHLWRCGKPNDCSLKAGERGYVVFGVVDPALQGQISNNNLAFSSEKNSSTKKDGSTNSVAFNEAASSLMQAALYYEKINGVQNNATYIVLAQMTPDVAADFSRTLSYRKYTYSRLSHTFDVIFSAADAYWHTPGGSLTYDSEDLVRIPVITPRPMLLPDNKQPKEESGDYPRLHMRNPFERLDITAEKPTDEARTTLSLELKNDQKQCASGDFTGTGELNTSSLTRINSLLKLHDKDKNRIYCNAATDFECLTLASMQHAIHADIAMIQRRDLFTGCYIHSDGSMPTQAEKTTMSRDEMVRRMLPEAGYLTRVSVTGSTLKTILKENDAIANQDPSAASSTAIDRGRSLSILGISKGEGLRKPSTSMADATAAGDQDDPGNTYYVNGAALDPSKIYTIATTDRLATGEPDFPEMSQVALVAPETFLPGTEKAYPIADLVVAELTAPGTNVMVEKSSVIGQIPFSPAPGASQSAAVTTKTQKFEDDLVRPFDEAMTAFHTVLPGQTSLSQIVRPAEQAVQQRRYMALTLQQLAASYSFTRSNLNDQQIGTQFGGVTNPNANTPHSDSISIADNLRLVENRNRYFSYGLDQLIAYSRNRAGSTTKSPSGVLNDGVTPLPLSTSSLQANSLMGSPFVQIEPFRDQPHLGAVLRELTNFDVAHSLQYVKSGISTTPPGAQSPESVYFPIEPLREYGYGFAVGPHFELSNSNYIETGYLRQYTTDLLHSIAIPGYLTETSLTANYSVSSLISATACPNSAKSCPGPFPAVSLSYNEVRQNGIYGMAVWHSTVPGYKQITNQWVFFGDWFGQGNPITRSSTETHYAANLSDTLTVSIAGNLSLGPQYTIFLFGDESSVQPNSLVRQQLSVALNYNFDWHYGLSWRSLWTPVK